jgi:predicted N-acyltransferase
MAYSYEMCATVREINEADWLAVCDLRANPFMDLRFLRAVEDAMGAETKFWYAIFYDEARRPVACTCYALYIVDGALFAPPLAQKMVRAVQRVIRPFFKFKVLLCGTPVGTGQGNIAHIPGADLEELAAKLDEIAAKLAKAERAGFIAFKEFDQPTVDSLAGLERRGYRVAKSVVKYSLPREFATFDEYYESRSKRTRANMRKFFQKFEDAGLRWEHVRGDGGLEQIYTDDVHELYLNVFRRAELKFELLPPAFFRELARQYPEEAWFTFIRKGDQIVGFCCALSSHASHDMLYCGIDYEQNPLGDVYFNLVYRALGQGIATGADLINVGQSADEFKRRLGCSSTQLYTFIRAAGALRSGIFNAAFKYLFEGPDAAPPPVEPETTEPVPADASAT